MNAKQTITPRLAHLIAVGAIFTTWLILSVVGWTVLPRLQQQTRHCDELWLEVNEIMPTYTTALSNVWMASRTKNTMICRGWATWELDDTRAGENWVEFFKFVNADDGLPRLAYRFLE